MWWQNHWLYMYLYKLSVYKTTQHLQSADSLSSLLYVNQPPCVLPHKEVKCVCVSVRGQKSSHQFSFNIHHVLCSCDTAAGSWILWGAFSGFTLRNTLETLNSQMNDGDHVDLCFHRCEQYWSHPARLNGCAAWTVFDHHLSGLWLFFDWWQLCNRLDQTVWRKTDGQDYCS